MKGRKRKKVRLRFNEKEFKETIKKMGQIKSCVVCHGGAFTKHPCGTKRGKTNWKEQCWETYTFLATYCKDCGQLFILNYIEEID